MGKVTRIPLEKRLQKTEGRKPNFLAAFELFAEDFFGEILQMTKNPVILQESRKTVSRYDYADGRARLLAEMVFIADGLPDKEKKELLYSMLVAPFACMQQERRKQDGYEFLDAGNHERDK